MAVEQNGSVEIFLHGKGAPQVVLALDSLTLREFLVLEDALPRAEEFVFVGQALDECALDGDDGHAPASLDFTLVELGILVRGHVHTRTVHRVHVEVFFNGAEQKHRFSPAATVERVTKWAKREFALDPHASADLVLALKPAGTQPRPDEHLGELLPPGTHVLQFDLVREVTPQG
jgi:hypothetical protein